MNRNFILTIGLLILSAFLVFPTLADSIIPNMEVNPNYYEVGVSIGDSRTYIFNYISQSYEMGKEMREMTIPVTFGGVSQNLTVTEGTKLHLEVISISTDGIELAQRYITLPNIEQQPDPWYENRSDLSLQGEHGPKLVMTTNTTLINEVYGPTSWDIVYTDYSVRFWIEESINDSYSRHEYEYDLYSGFLQNIHISESGPDRFFNLDINQVMEWNPNWYTLGVNIGDSNTYVVNAVKYYDWNTNDYFHDMSVMAIHDGEPYYFSLHVGDSFTITVVDILTPYVEFRISYYLKTSGATIVDESYYYLDRATGQSRIFFGPPFLMTTNTTLIGEYAPVEITVEDSQVKWENQWSSEDGIYKQEEKGAWNFTTGWLISYYHLELENGAVRRETEFIDSDWLPDDGEHGIIGVGVGDYVILVLLDAYNHDNEDTATMNMNLKIDGTEVELILRSGDKFHIELTAIDGTEVTLVLTVTSAADGDTVADPMTYDLLNPKLGEGGVPFLLPNKTELIEDIFSFNPDLEISYPDSERVVIALSSSESDNKVRTMQLTYDLKTGWLIGITSDVSVDGISMENFVIEASKFTGGEETESKGTDIPELTPLPFWPVLLALLVLPVSIRKKHK